MKAFGEAAFSLNDLVQVSVQYYWAAGATGRIADPPPSIVDLAPGWDGLTRFDPDHPDGPRYTYWVRFDQPQRDFDGTGPYEEAEIDARYLNLLKHS